MFIQSKLGVGTRWVRSSVRFRAESKNEADIHAPIPILQKKLPSTEASSEFDSSSWNNNNSYCFVRSVGSAQKPFDVQTERSCPPQDIQASSVKIQMYLRLKVCWHRLRHAQKNQPKTMDSSIPSRCSSDSNFFYLHLHFHVLRFFSFNFRFLQKISLPQETHFRRLTFPSFHFKKLDRARVSSPKNDRSPRPSILVWPRPHPSSFHASPCVSLMRTRLRV